METVRIRFDRDGLGQTVRIGIRRRLTANVYLKHYQYRIASQQRCNHGGDNDGNDDIDDGGGNYLKTIAHCN